MFSDLRYALRTLAKAPGFTVVAVLTLALCIGANSAIFSVVHSVLLQPYPWPKSDRLVYLANAYGGKRGADSIPDYLDRRAGISVLEESAIYHWQDLVLTGRGAPERVAVVCASPSLFPLLGTPAARGRVFADADAQPGVPKTVVLAHDFWQTRFGGDPAVVGQTIRLDGELWTVAGVMPAGFYFPSPRVQMWVPFVFTAAQKTDAERGNQYSTVIGRLKAGATVADAQRDVDEINRRNRARLPEWRSFWEASRFGAVVTGFLEQNVAGVRSMLWCLQGGVLAVLLVGCANVANLLLARASGRARELAIRSALGGSRGRIVRQLLTESLVLFVLGGALGWLVALWSMSALGTFGVSQLPRGFAVQLDGSVFLFTLAGTLVAGLVAGGLPAWLATRGAAVDVLKDAGSHGTVSRRHLSLRGALVVAEIALAFLLLATAGLLMKSFRRLQEVNPGFSPEQVLTASVELVGAKYQTAESKRLFADQLLACVRALPGVTSVGTTSVLPFSGGAVSESYLIEGFPQSAASPVASIRFVTPDYFRTLDIAVLRGRGFSEHDTASAEHVVMIDRLLADRYWPGGDPIGQRLSYVGAAETPGTWTIIGVVPTIKDNSLEESVAQETLYFPVAQAPNGGFTLVMKTSVPAAALAGPLRAAVAGLDPGLPVADLKTMEARLDESLQRRRTPMLLLGIFSGLALVLAALGVYGVTAFAVHQRTPEIGIRMALGATQFDVLRLIVRQGLVLVGCGLALGLLGYFALGAVIGPLLFNVTLGDPATLVGAPCILAFVALAACFVPARRATLVDPLVALRTE